MHLSQFNASSLSTKSNVVDVVNSLDRYMTVRRSAGMPCIIDALGSVSLGVNRCQWHDSSLELAAATQNSYPSPPSFCRITASSSAPLAICSPSFSVSFCILSAKSSSSSSTASAPT